MRKRLFLLIAAVISVLSASAQFESDKVYIGGSLTGLNMNYSGNSDFSMGLQAQAGYMVDDDIMLLGSAAYRHVGASNTSDYYSVGVGGRYYIEQNGIFLGINCKYMHAKNYNDFMPGVEVGYAFFLSRTVTLEPAIYYDQSFKKHSDYSTIGFKIGLGIYL